MCTVYAHTHSLSIGQQQKVRTRMKNDDAWSEIVKCGANDQITRGRIHENPDATQNWMISVVFLVCSIDRDSEHQTYAYAYARGLVFLLNCFYVLFSLFRFLNCRLGRMCWSRARSFFSLHCVCSAVTYKKRAVSLPPFAIYDCPIAIIVLFDFGSFLILFPLVGFRSLLRWLNCCQFFCCIFKFNIAPSLF